MPSEVGSGQVSIFPVFKGFRKAVDAEVDSSSKSASTRFASGFKSAGSTAGRGFSAGFKASTSTVTADALKRASADVAAASRAVSAARLKELDVAGKLRLADTQLSEARQKYASDSAQVVRAEERVASVQRAAAAAEQNTAAASDRLTAAQRAVASSADSAASSGRRMQGVFGQLPTILGNTGAGAARRFSSGFLDVLGGALGANILTGVGFTIGRGINEGITSALGAGLQGVQLASDLSETTSAVRQVFGAAADDIVAYSKTANKALGQTQQSALQGAQTFGVFATQAGLTGPPLAKFSTGLVTLSGDLASFFNTSPEDAIQAIGAGLRGESEPLRRYGVLLDDATLKQRAMTLGIYSGSGSLTQQQRILAAQAEILAQTGIAQGDFARTSGGLANQQRILQASLQDTQTKFGTYLLPAFTSAAQFANGSLLPALGSVIDKVGPKFATALENSAPKVQALLDKLVPMAIQFGDLAAEEGIPAVIDLLDQFADAAPGWVDAWSFLNDPNAEPAHTLNEIAKFDPFGDWSLAEGLSDFLNSPVPWAGAFGDIGLKFNAGGKEVVGQFSAGVQTADGWERSNQAADEHTKAVVAQIVAHEAEMNKAGQNLAQALADGIRGKKGTVTSAGHAVAEAAVRATEKGFDIRSPSHVGTAIGANYGGAIASGMLGQRSVVGRAGSAVAGAAFAPSSAVAGHAASSPSVATGAPSGAGMPSQVAFYDADGVFQGMIQLAAAAVVQQKFDALKAEDLAGGTAR